MTFRNIAIRSNNDAQVIIEGIRNKFFTFFPATSNIGKIYIGDQSVSYDNKKGYEITPLSDTIGLSYIRRFYVTYSNDWYMSGLKDDVMNVIIEDNPTDVYLDLIVLLLNEIKDKL